MSCGNPTAWAAPAGTARRPVPLSPGASCSVGDRRTGGGLAAAGQGHRGGGRGGRRAGDVRAHRAVRRGLPGQPALRLQPVLRSGRRPARRAGRVLRAVGRDPRRAAGRLRARRAHPADRALRPRQLAAPAGQPALPVRVRRDDRGAHGPRRVPLLLPLLRLLRAGVLRGRARRFGPDPGRRVGGHLRGARRVPLPLPPGPGDQPLPVPVLPAAALPRLDRARLLVRPPVAGGAGRGQRSGRGLPGPCGGLRRRVPLRLGALPGWG